MKYSKILTLPLLSVFILSSFLIASPNAAHAGGCDDPIEKVDLSGKVLTGAYVRSIPCMEGSEILETVSAHSNVTVIGKVHGWFQVITPSGNTGFIGSQLLSVGEVVAYAMPIKEKEHKAIPKPVHYKKHKKYKKDTKGIRERVKGRILLQVEKHGEAWYVDPVTTRRFYMKDGDTAYQMMRSFGLGVSTKDYKDISNKYSAVNKRLRGRIILKVEENGEAYYIHPEKGSLHYLKNGKEAYRIMRELGLGITNEDIDEVEQDSL